MPNELYTELDRLRKINAEMLAALKYWFDPKAETVKLVEMAQTCINKAEGRG